MPILVSEVKVSQSGPTLLLCGLYSPWDSPGQNTGVDSHSLLQGIFPTQESNPGLPQVSHRQILYHLNHQGNPRILEWVAYPFSSGSSQPRNQTRISCIAGESLPIELSVQFSSVYSLSRVQLFATPWTIQSMEFCRPQYGSG